MTKKTPINELQRLSPSELHKELSLRRASYARHHIGVTMQSEKNHAACRLMRRDIARMSMVLQNFEKALKSEKNVKVQADNVTALSSVSSGSSAKKPVKSVRSKSKKAE